MNLKKGDKVGIVGCSNAQMLSNKQSIEMLISTIKEIGLVPVFSECIFEKYSVFSGSGEERAGELIKLYNYKEVKAIFDISGGDIANEILEYLDFDTIKNNTKPFFGYSDLTTIINAIYTMTGNISYLYQIRNLINEDKEIQRKRFINSLFHGEKDLFDIKYSFVQGDKMKGIVVGGNVRCLLKLAGTPYLPDFKNKILFLEACGCSPALLTAFFSQLKQMGVFLKINGILLGTFTQMEQNNVKPEVIDILKNVLKNDKMPIAKTREIGHGSDSKCIAIGKKQSFE
ncbi:MAG: LD-carboxypeptidase [Clostridium sp.]|nr:LD-carboxypeptidase [Clostridium sp.]